MSGLFDDLEDPNDFGDFARPATGELRQPVVTEATPVGAFKEICPRCRGTGRFTYGRACYACKGKGFKLFATSTEKRVKAKANRQQSKQAAAEAWMAAHPAELAWLLPGNGYNDFKTSLLQAVAKYGTLTENQLAAVRKGLARDAEYAAKREQAEANATTLDVSAMERAFEAARAARLKWPKLRLDPFVFKPASASSKNAGSIYVTRGEDYLGRITDSRFVRAFKCDDPTEADIVRAASDPAAAAKVHGQQTGRCSCCGLELTNADSIALGIGPICAGKWGW